jgi:hypothetical protein
MTVALFRGGELVYRQTVTVPAAGDARRIATPQADDPIVLVEPTSPRLDGSQESLELSKEEMGKLRALGYVE